MAAYVSRRLILALFTIFAISALSFFIIELPQGDLATKRLDRTMDYTTGPAQAEEIAAELRRYLQLDKPVYIRYFLWLGGLLKGDLGRSYVQKAEVSELIASRLPATLLLMAGAIFFELLIGLPLGWSPSTEGMVEGTPVLAPLKRESNQKRDEAAVDDFIKKHKGKLKNQIVLIAPLKEVKPQAEAAMRRWTEEELKERAAAPRLVPPIDFDDPELVIPAEPEKRREFFRQAPRWFREKNRK